jgi:hypothetical protein
MIKHRALCPPNGLELVKALAAVDAHLLIVRDNPSTVHHLSPLRAPRLDLGDPDPK